MESRVTGRTSLMAIYAHLTYELTYLLTRGVTGGSVVVPMTIAGELQGRGFGTTLSALVGTLKTRR